MKYGEVEDWITHRVSFDSSADQFMVTSSAPRGLDAVSFQIVEPSAGSRLNAGDGNHCVPVLH